MLKSLLNLVYCIILGQKSNWGLTALEAETLTIRQRRSMVPDSDNIEFNFFINIFQRKVILYLSKMLKNFHSNR